MRKNNIFIITLIILIPFVNLVYANSGPIYWEGHPSLEILSIEENSPIIVENEDLIFDFSKDEYLEQGDHSISGLVTATYRMSNQTNNNQTVQMAFPIISSLSHFNLKDIAIKVDNENVPFDIYIGDEVRSIGNKKDNQENDRLNFKQIVKSINKEVYTPLHYNLNEVGKLYTYDVSTTSENNVNFVIDFTYNYEKTKIISKGFNGYRGNNNEVKITAWIDDNETLEVYVIGEDIDLNISGFADDKLSQKTNDYSYEVKEESISIGDYLKKSINNYEDLVRYNDYLTDNQLFNLFSKELDEIIGHDVSYFWIDDFYSLAYENRIFVFVYETSFPKQSKRDVSVSYLMGGTMDKTSTYDPLYTFEYLLNPAEKWADFNNLNIKIKPPKDHPYIVDSSIDLSRNEEGNYVGNFKFLPDKDLSFTLYSKEKITYIDKIKRKVDNLSYALPFIITTGIPLLVVLIKKIFGALIYKLGGE
jgi:hypothetical protein